MDEQCDSVSVPHAFGRFPLNLGAMLLPFIWGAFHGVTSGIAVQLVGAAAFVGASLAARQMGSESTPLALALWIAGAAVCIYFGLVADRLAWRRRHDRDWAAYVRSERLWTAGIVLWSLAVTWYRFALQ